MAVTVTMPQLGESVTEGTISKWLKQPGERIERYEPIAEVITDKVNAEVPAPSDGVMGDLIAAEGDTVPVGGAICTIRGLEEGAAPSAPAPAPAAAAPPPAPQPAPEPAAPAATPGPRPVVATAAQPAPAPAPVAPAVPAPMAEPVPVAAAAAPAPAAPPDAGGAGLHVSPAVRMLAREHAVDLARIPGSGLGGRITKKDILEWVQQRDSTPAPVPVAQAGAAVPAAVPEAALAAPPTAAPAPAPAPAAAAPAAAVTTGDTLVPLSPMRKAIAEHMVRSVQTAPHAWVMVECDMSPVVALRERHRAAFEQRTGVKLTFLPFVAQAVIGALRKHPTLNASFTPEGILLKRDLNLGIAVALEDGLVVPVVHGADRLSLAGLAEAFQRLGDRARAAQLRLEDIQGGTFTLNNAGALGTLMTQPIINQPQAAILATDAIVKRPVVVAGDAIAVRPMMNLCLSFDHRINDGLQATRFISTVRDTLQAMDDRVLG
jgi:pyruvate/2-oxoglutarate dehydrogenase complex dihydrolipoamide acyltransferase (E2) component